MLNSARKMICEGSVTDEGLDTAVHLNTAVGCHCQCSAAHVEHYEQYFQPACQRDACTPLLAGLMRGPSRHRQRTLDGRCCLWGPRGPGKAASVIIEPTIQPGLGNLLIAYLEVDSHFGGGLVKGSAGSTRTRTPLIAGFGCTRDSVSASY